ncbi:MAG: MurR/RpiR family transcriptional regulator [Alphaproteobacteria bacterium]|nr:MAG: MurR/RpiR family transcriptional regulator [Alphaproteobacteria bacterium]
MNEMGRELTPGDTVLDRIHAMMDRLTTRERRVAQILLANFPLAGLETVSVFAHKAGVSTATVLRFVNKLGFPVYAEFQAALRAQLETTLQSPLLRLERGNATRRGDQGSFLRTYADGVIANIRALVDALPEHEFNRVVELLCDDRREILVLGGRYTSKVGRYFADFLKTLRPRVTYVEGQTQTWANYLLDVRRNTVLLVFDTRRYQSDVIEFSRMAAAHGATIVLFTDPWHSDIAKVADHVLSFPVTSESIFDSMAVGMVLVEALQGALAVCLDDKARERLARLDALRAPLMPPRNGTDGD